MIETLMRWADVTAGELWLLAFGILAQMVFLGRWIVQWIASERRGHSHMPELFWWLSLVGATLLVVYFALRGEPVGLMGQSAGWIVYIRNLHLLKKARPLPEGPGGEFQPPPPS